MFTLAIILLASSVLADRPVVVKNSCSYPIWPGFSGLEFGTGYKLEAGASQTTNIPDKWTVSRIWARTGCDDSGMNCGTGDCGALECKAWGKSGATLFELNVPGDGSDWIDISLVDGGNIPVTVTWDGDSLGCPFNANSCPADLQYKDGSGKVIGCMSDCELQKEGKMPGDPNNSALCCSGSTYDTCTSDKVPNYGFYKQICPAAYAYPRDDIESLHKSPEPFTNVVKNPPSTTKYTVDFCGGGGGNAKRSSISSRRASGKRSHFANARAMRIH